MFGYPYIEQLFKNVLAESTVIQGRFFISPSWGSELNTNGLESVIDDLNAKIPLVVMMPPRTTGDYTRPDTRDAYDIVLFFLTGTHRNGDGEVKQPRADIPNKSGHTITEDWHDMKRCAKSFMGTLHELTVDKGLSQYFTVSGREPQVMEPVSNIGTKKLSGIKLSFKAYLHLSCDKEDYQAGYMDRIQIPTIDSHPEHTH